MTTRCGSRASDSDHTAIIVDIADPVIRITVGEQAARQASGGAPCAAGNGAPLAVIAVSPTSRLWGRLTALLALQIA